MSDDIRSNEKPSAKFREIVDKMTQEWLEKGGNVTCEFSTDKQDMAEKLDYVHEKAKEGVNWFIRRCETCEHHSEGRFPYHVGIVHD